ncbi:MAG: ferritin-like domain-containing protein [Minicystis sp.]
MLDPTSFRRRLAARLVAAVLPPVVALATSGCCHEGTGTTQFDWPVEEACPPQGEAAFYMTSFRGPDECGTHLVSIDGPGERDGGACEYPITYESCDCGHGFGRPYREEGAPLTAPPIRSAAWLDLDVHPDVGGLSAEERRDLAARFRRQALLEHASIASFARASLALMAAGAPPDLVAGAHHAALDEVEHARLCFALASAYSGAPEGPGRFPVTGSLAVNGDLAQLAADTARDGCIEETISTIEAAEALAGAVDPAVRAALERIVEDEARHAELAWRTVAWAIRTGGPEVAAAVAEVLADARRTARDARAQRAFAEVVLPAARALLAA